MSKLTSTFVPPQCAGVPARAAAPAKAPQSPSFKALYSKELTKLLSQLVFLR